MLGDEKFTHKIVSRKALAADSTKNNTVLSSGQKPAGSDDMTPRRGGCCLMVGTIPHQYGFCQQCDFFFCVTNFPSP
jgi:hypothetical protein